MATWSRLTLAGLVTFASAQTGWADGKLVGNFEETLTDSQLVGASPFVSAQQIAGALIAPPLSVSFRYDPQFGTTACIWLRSNKGKKYEGKALFDLSDVATGPTTLSLDSNYLTYLSQLRDQELAIEVRFVKSCGERNENDLHAVAWTGTSAQSGDVHVFFQSIGSDAYFSFDAKGPAKCQRVTGVIYDTDCVVAKFEQTTPTRFQIDLYDAFGRSNGNLSFQLIK